VVHNTALNNSDNLPYYPPDNHHSSDSIYGMGGETEFSDKTQCIHKKMHQTAFLAHVHCNQKATSTRNFKFFRTSVPITKEHYADGSVCSS